MISNTGLTHLGSKAFIYISFQISNLQIWLFYEHVNSINLFRPDQFILYILSKNLYLILEGELFKSKHADLTSSISNLLGKSKLKLKIFLYLTIINENLLSQSKERQNFKRLKI